MNTIEEVVYANVKAGASSTSVSFVPPAGDIIGVKIFYGAKNNPGIVNASIEDNNKQELSKMQHIDNYRDRDCEYPLSGKTFLYQGGSKMFFKIQAQANFAADFDAQLILIYLNPC